MDYYYFCTRHNRSFSTLLSLIVGVLLLTGLFFLALPIFLAALTVFSAFAAYIAWRIRKTVRKMEEEMAKDMRQVEEGTYYSEIIDIDPEQEE